LARYVIKLHGPNGAVVSEHLVDLDDDDAAINLAGEFDHPDEIHVWQRERLVVRFTPRRAWPTRAQSR
jgi:hypothetical protein